MGFITFFSIDPVLGNDRRISKYTTVVTEYRLRKQACFYGNEREQQQRMETAVRREGGWCEMAASLGVSPWSWLVNYWIVEAYVAVRSW
jgi:hypothetical protein